MLRRWRTAGKSRTQIFIEQKRKELQEEKKKEEEERKRDKEVNDWLTGHHRDIPTHIMYWKKRTINRRKRWNHLDFGI